LLVRLYETLTSPVCHRGKGFRPITIMKQGQYARMPSDGSRPNEMTNIPPALSSRSGGLSPRKSCSPGVSLPRRLRRPSRRISPFPPPTPPPPPSSLAADLCCGRPLPSASSSPECRRGTPPHRLRATRRQRPARLSVQGGGWGGAAREGEGEAWLGRGGLAAAGCRCA